MSQQDKTFYIDNWNYIHVLFEHTIIVNSGLLMWSITIFYILLNIKKMLICWTFIRLIILSNISTLKLVRSQNIKDFYIMKNYILLSFYIFILFDNKFLLYYISYCE